MSHRTGQCNLSAFDDHHLVHRRMHAFEGGMTVLQGRPLYTNIIVGLNDCFLHRNTPLNLRDILPNLNAAHHDPYLAHNESRYEAMTYIDFP